MSMPGATELIIIAVVLVLLFGAKKLPEMARGIGRSMRILKSETSKLRDDDDDTTVQAQPIAEPTAQPQPQQQVTPQSIPPAPALSAEEQARLLEEQAARLRASAGQANKQA
ncbi:Sec-independent protein translocase subunit TatA [Nonomuraea sp. LPB2021202275-12-8]|uniref:Sec-independent protein translocase subunit TatA n=1 Tax=Nonomuraea sp. LPB2021202275-12-8 TaxID=3120159 RepID=UPI00300C3F59